MTIARDIALARLGTYLGEVMPSRLKSNANRFAFAFLRPALPALIERGGWWAKLAAVGILTDEGIDLDLLGECVRAGFASAPTIDLMGVGFDLQDAEGLLTHLRG